MPCLQCGHCGKCGMYTGLRMELVCPECGNSVVPGTAECAVCGEPAKRALQANLEELRNKQAELMQEASSTNAGNGDWSI